MCNYRHPGLRRVWKGASDLQSDPPFPLNPVDPVQSSCRLQKVVFYNDFCTFCKKMITIFGGLSSQTLFFTMISAHLPRPFLGVELSNTVFYNFVCTFSLKMITSLWGYSLGRPLGAKMAPHAIWTACGAPFGGLLGLMLAPRCPKWRQDEPSWR